MKFWKGEDGRQQTKKNTQRTGNANENEGSEMTEKPVKTNSKHAHLGVCKSRNNGGMGQVSKIRRNEEEPSEGAKNDNIAALLGRLVGRGDQ